MNVFQRCFWYLFVNIFASCCVDSTEEISCNIGCSERTRSVNQCRVRELSEIWPEEIDDRIISKPVGCQFQHFTVTGEEKNNIYMNVSWIYKGLPPQEGFLVGISSIDSALWFHIRLPRNTKMSIEMEAIFKFRHCAPSYVPNWSYTASIITANGKPEEEKINQCKVEKHIPDCCSFENPSKFQVCQFNNCFDQRDLRKYRGNNIKIETNWTKPLATTVVVILIITASIVIIGSILLFRRRNIAELRPKSYAVVLASTGDKQSKYRSIANEVAWEIKCSGRYDDVYYNGWCTNQDSGILRKKIAKCTAAVIITSPFGKKSYDEFMRRKGVSVWKDGFVLGSYSLINGFRFSFCSYPKIFVAYHADEPDEDVNYHLHNDFKKAAKYCRNISELSERQKLLVDINNSAA